MAPAVDREGYWGPPTSTLDWCEENYAVSYYIAEFCEWNRASLLPPVPFCAPSGCCDGPIVPTFRPKGREISLLL